MTAPYIAFYYDEVHPTHPWCLVTVHPDGHETGLVVGRNYIELLGCLQDKIARHEIGPEA